MKASCLGDQFFGCWALDVEDGWAADDSREVEEHFLDGLEDGIFVFPV